MTTAHKIQVALLALGYILLGWVIYAEAKGWLKEERRKRAKRLTKATVKQGGEWEGAA